MIVLYNKKVNFSFPGMAYCHPANLTKYAQAVSLLPAGIEVLSPKLEHCGDLLAQVHAPAYLKSAISGDPLVYAGATEVPHLRHAPAWAIRLTLVRPILAAVSLTVTAARLAWQDKQVVFAVGGGFHHAKPSRGEGFCLLNDVAVAIASLRQTLDPPQRIAYIDVDAHMGNGVAHCFVGDDSVKLFDLYMANYYPASDQIAEARLDYGVPLTNGSDVEGYLYHLTDCLGPWLDCVNPEMAFINVGQDVLKDDPLTCFEFSQDDVLRRDQALGKVIAERGIPAVFVAGGGYTSDAGFVLARTANAVYESVKR